VVCLDGPVLAHEPGQVRGVGLIIPLREEFDCARRPPQRVRASRVEARARSGGRVLEPCRLFPRGGQQPADAVGVRDDVMDGCDAGEPGVC
jgi:hypothetical protein